MNITKKDIDALNAELSITLAPQDYEEKVNDAIKKVQKQAAMPGFRAGKVPVGLIKKQYGKSILVDEINKILNDSLYNYINDNKIEILGNPMPKENSVVDFDTKTEWTFEYELGLSPQFDLKLDNSQSFTYNTVKVDDELVEKYLKDVKRNYGKPSNPEVAEAKDVLYIDIVELDADGSIKPGGVFKSTSIGIDRLKNEAAKAKLTGAKKEDKIVINANELYDSAVDKSMSLGIDKEAAESFDANLQITVKNIARMEDAELNQELFDKLYGRRERELRSGVQGQDQRRAGHYVCPGYRPQICGNGRERPGRQAEHPSSGRVPETLADGGEREAAYQRAAGFGVPCLCSLHAMETDREQDH